MRKDALDRRRGVAERPQGAGHRLVDDAHRAAAHQPFELDEPEIRLDPGRVAVHQQADCSCRGQHRRLGVPHPASVSPFTRRVPCLPGCIEHKRWREFLVDPSRRSTVLIQHPKHRLPILVEPGEGPHAFGQLG